MATKKATASKQYTAWLIDEIAFSSSIEEAADGYGDEDQIVVYEMVEVGRFEVVTKPTLKPIK